VKKRSREMKIEEKEKPRSRPITEVGKKKMSRICYPGQNCLSRGKQ